MGSTQSVPSTQEINDVSRQRSIAVGNSNQSARNGQETIKTNETSAKISNNTHVDAADLTEKLSISSTEVDADDEASVVSTDSEYDSDEELDEEYEGT